MKVRDVVFPLLPIVFNERGFIILDQEIRLQIAEEQSAFVTEVVAVNGLGLRQGQYERKGSKSALDSFKYR